MRTILFRGRRVDNGEWVKGLLSKARDGEGKLQFCIVEEHPFDDRVVFFIIDPETIGQFTGLQDRLGKDIYEGDIVKVTDDEGCTDFSDGGIGSVGNMGELFMWYIDGAVQNGLFDINQSYEIEVVAISTTAPNC